MTQDGYLIMARVFWVIAVLLVAYLAACGINAGIEWVVQQVREWRDRR